MVIRMFCQVGAETFYTCQTAMSESQWTLKCMAHHSKVHLNLKMCFSYCIVG